MITYYPKEQQNKNNFNNGEIIENQPVVYTPGGSAKPFSNLFYWAHATGVVDSLIGEHPHQGFEIITFILKGTTSHYDTLNQEWVPLNAGDAQVIRAGSGVSHAEKFHQGSEGFQIWFDPDLNKTLGKPASYNDYRAIDFPITIDNGLTIKTYFGTGSPMQLDTEGLEIKEVTFTSGQFDIELDINKAHSIYLVAGKATVRDVQQKADDFLVLKAEKSFNFIADGDGKWFMISSPLAPSYKTYAQYRGI